MMRNAPVILPVFTTSVPLDFPSEGTFAFNKKTSKQLEVTVRINEHQYFNMNFLNHDGYIMACCRWAHVLDGAVPADGRAKVTTGVNTAKLTVAFLIMSYINVRM